MFSKMHLLDLLSGFDLVLAVEKIHFSFVMVLLSVIVLLGHFKRVEMTIFGLLGILRQLGSHHPYSFLLLDISNHLFELTFLQLFNVFSLCQLSM